MNDLIAVTIYTSGPSCMACTRTAPIICVSTTAGEHYWDGYRPDRIDWLAQLL